MILKADAIKAVGLKTITAKHLALAAQALTGVLTLMPFLRSTFASIITDQMKVSGIIDDSLY